MRVRLIWSISILTPFLVLVWADFNHNGGAPCAWLFFVALLIALLATLELHPLLAPAELLPSRWLCLFDVLLVMSATAVPVYWPLALREPFPADCPVGPLGCTLGGFVLALGMSLGDQMFRYRQPSGRAVIQAALATFVAGYLGVLASFLVLLRTFENNEWGMVALGSTIAIVKTSDIAAYVAGRSLGRRRLAPLLSPKKTVEGAMGGLVGAVLAAILCRLLLVPFIVTEGKLTGDWLAWIGLGLWLSLAGMIGDLAESLIKRDAGQKDSSRWLPGLGGALDLMDSLLFAGPVAYAVWSMGWIGPR